jgi:hypothetical protein
MLVGCKFRYSLDAIFLLCC